MRPVPTVLRSVRVGTFVLLAACCAGLAAAQLELRIDGRPVGEVRTDLVAGTSYAPLDAITSGLGGRAVAPPGGTTAALTVGGHVLALDVVDQGSSPNRPAALRMDGRPAGDLAAIRGDDAVWAPVAATARAFGAQVAYLPEESAVLVVGPRPNLTDARIDGGSALETLSLRFDAPVAWIERAVPASDALELVVRRGRVDRARSLSGERFARVDLLPDAEGATVRITAPGSEFEVIAVAAGSGTDLRVRARARADEAERDAVPEGSVRIALDPAPPNGGEDRMGPLADAVAERLRAAGATVEITRSGAADPGPERRAAAAARADLFVALHPAGLGPGEVRLWVLGEAQDDAALAYAIRRNARAAAENGNVNDLRRELLLGLVPDADAGRRAADAMAEALFQSAGYRAGAVGEAPLAVLSGAAGRGVLIEMAPEAATDDAFADALAAAIRTATRGTR